MSDIKQLRNECRYKMADFDLNWLDDRWVDLQQEFDDRLGLHNSLALKHALGAMNRNFEGTAHTALDDAINTSAILVLMQDDAAFRKTMQPVLDILRPQGGFIELHRRSLPGAFGAAEKSRVNAFLFALNIQEL